MHINLSKLTEDQLERLRGALDDPKPIDTELTRRTNWSQKRTEGYLVRHPLDTYIDITYRQKSGEVEITIQHRYDDKRRSFTDLSRARTYLLQVMANNYIGVDDDKEELYICNEEDELYLVYALSSAHAAMKVFAVYRQDWETIAEYTCTPDDFKRIHFNPYNRTGRVGR